MTSNKKPIRIFRLHSLSGGNVSRTPIHFQQQEIVEQHGIRRIISLESSSSSSKEQFLPGKEFKEIQPNENKEIQLKQEFKEIQLKQEFGETKQFAGQSKGYKKSQEEFEWKSGKSYFIIQCPHCLAEDIFLYKHEIACTIFRHGAMINNTNQTIGPHTSKEECDRLAKSGTVVGCSKPFSIKLVSDNGKNYAIAEICDYK
jgi:hypothetical protein